MSCDKVGALLKVLTQHDEMCIQLIQLFLIAMNSLVESCTPLKAQYDGCFNIWFKNYFLKGRGAERSHDQACGELFEQYQKCLTVKLESTYFYRIIFYFYIIGRLGETENFD